MGISETIMDAGSGAFIILAPATAEHGQWLTETEKAEAELLSPERRRAEWTAWRAVARRTLGPVGIGYEPSGAPVLTSFSALRPEIKHISVSHTADAVAVLFSPHKCAVDIEEADRRFDRAASRYVSSAERMLPEARSRHFEGIIWCIKESAYKYAGKNAPDFIRDIRVESLKLREDDSGTYGEAGCRVCGERIPAANFRLASGLIVAWIT